MADLAVLSTPNNESAPDCAPRRLTAELQSVEIEVIQFQRDGTMAIPYLWMTGVSTDEFESVLRKDPQVPDFKQLEQTDEGALYKVEWQVDSPLIQCVATTNGIVMQARGSSDEWRLKIWFEDGSGASAFQQCCRNQQIPITVERLSSVATILSETPTTISQAQQEALVRAYEGGYFDDPRRVSQEDLAAELGITSSAVGRRLRRGFRNLIEETMIE